MRGLLETLADSGKAHSCSTFNKNELKSRLSATGQPWNSKRGNEIAAKCVRLFWTILYFSAPVKMFWEGRMKQQSGIMVDVLINSLTLLLQSAQNQSHQFFKWNSTSLSYRTRQSLSMQTVLFAHRLQRKRWNKLPGVFHNEPANSCGQTSKVFSFLQQRPVVFLTL